MTQREIIRKHLNKSDWEITTDKCDSTRAHRRHLAANGKHETERKIYCTNVHLRIIGILITSVYNSVLSLPPLHGNSLLLQCITSGKGMWMRTKSSIGPTHSYVNLKTPPSEGTGFPRMRNRRENRPTLAPTMGWRLQLTRQLRRGHHPLQEHKVLHNHKHHHKHHHKQHNHKHHHKYQHKHHYVYHKHKQTHTYNMHKHR